MNEVWAVMGWNIFVSGLITRQTVLFRPQIEDCTFVGNGINGKVVLQTGAPSGRIRGPIDQLGVGGWGWKRAKISGKSANERVWNYQRLVLRR